MIPTALVFFPTLGCNYRCKHCSVESSPELLRYRTLDINLIYKMIDEAYWVPSIKVVVFTGGEPTLKSKILKEGISYASKKGFITRMVSNAWWASSYKKAVGYLKELRSLGLNELNLSYSDFHAEWAEDGEEKVVNAIKAGLSLGLSVAVAITTHKSAKITAETVKDILAQNGIDYGKIVLKEDSFASLGRAANLPEDYRIYEEQSSLGCPYILRAIGVLPEGQLTACCEHAIFDAEVTDEYTIGYAGADSLKESLRRAQRNLFYWWLTTKHPSEIIKFLGGQDEKFTHICHACHTLLSRYKGQLYSTLLERKHEIFFKEIILSDVLDRLTHVLREPMRWA